MLEVDIFIYKETCLPDPKLLVEIYYLEFLFGSKTGGDGKAFNSICQWMKRT